MLDCAFWMLKEGLDVTTTIARKGTAPGRVHSGTHSAYNIFYLLSGSLVKLSVDPWKACCFISLWDHHDLNLLTSILFLIVILLNIVTLNISAIVSLTCCTTSTTYILITSNPQVLALYINQNLCILKLLFLLLSETTSSLDVSLLVLMSCPLAWWDHRTHNEILTQLRHPSTIYNIMMMIELWYWRRPTLFKGVITRAQFEARGLQLSTTAMHFVNVMAIEYVLDFFNTSQKVFFFNRSSHSTVVEFLWRCHWRRLQHRILPYSALLAVPFYYSWCHSAFSLCIPWRWLMIDQRISACRWVIVIEHVPVWRLACTESLVQLLLLLPTEYSFFHY